MEIITLLFIITMPIAFLLWTLKFHSELVLIALAPLMMLNTIVILLNVEVADSGNPPILTYTHKAIINQTATVVGNTTTTTNVYGDVPDEFPVGYQNLQVLNVLMTVFTLATAFIILRRVVQARQATEE